jgi:DnaJ-class molecular chaperone
MLGASNEDSIEDIKRLYRKLAMIHHPDRGGDEDRFINIKRAYDFLTENNCDAGDEKVNVSPGIFFKSIRVELSLEDAFAGVPSKRVILSENPSIEVSVSVLPGVVDGEAIEQHEFMGISGAGGKDKPVIVKCSMIASIKSNYTVEWGEVERQKRGDVKRDELVSPFKMILGGWHEVDTISKKKITVYIPEGLKANSTLKVKGHGYWRDSLLLEQGDMYLRIVPDIRKIFDYNSGELNQFIKKINGEN